MTVNFGFFNTTSACCGVVYFPSQLLLRYGNNPSDKHQSVLDKTKKALRKIASENRINRNRISDWLKIEVDE